MYLWSTLVYLSLVAWLPITSAVELGAVGSSFSGSFARIIGRVLRGHVGHEFEAINPVFCRKKCGLYKNCVSINVFALPDQKFLCQLNIARKQDCPDAQFVQSTSGEYYEVKEQNVCTKPGVCGAETSGLSLPTGLPSCSAIKKHHPNSKSGHYEITPKLFGSSIKVHCDMEAENGVGVTVIGHDSEDRTLVNGYESAGSYVRKIVYEADADSLVALTKSSQHCKQFIKYECYGALLFRANECWWVSRDGHRMNYWGGANGQNKKCACALTNSCAGGVNCNCDANDAEWQKDEGFFTDKSILPVSSLHFGDTGGENEKGFHTLGKLLCWG